MDNFNNYFGQADNVKLSKGIILAKDNEVSDGNDLLYWCYLIPNLTNNYIKVIGECGFDPEYEKTAFEFDYESDTDIVFYEKEYRTVIVEKETFDKYGKILKTEKSLNNCLPWIRFPRTKDGVTIPLLIERIFTKIPKSIVFTK